MMFGLKLTVEPAEEPISLIEARLHLRLDVAETSPLTTHPDDTLINIWLKAARRYVEGFNNRASITQTWQLYLDRFPRSRYIPLPKPPLQYVNSISYKDSAGTLQVVSFIDPSGTALLETDDYIVDIAQEPGRLCLQNGSTWPQTIREAQAVIVEYVCGYDGAANVPDDVKAAILLKLSDLYENRGDSERTHVANTKDDAVKALLWHDKVVYL